MAFVFPLPQNRAQSPDSPSRVKLQPQFLPGQVMRYRMTVESESSARRSGAIKDAQGPSALNITWDSTIRLETMPAEAASPARGAPLRFRITYESSQATVRSDTPEPRAADIERQYADLAGRSLEFAFAPGGQIFDIRGLEPALADDRARAVIQQWIAQLSAGSAVPPAGVIPGQKWDTLQPADLPLGGFAWRTDFTYLRNEPCRLGTAEAKNAPPLSAERADCAVILSRLTLVNPRSSGDPTPDQYRRNNLHTSGSWTGTGQNLTYVSLDTGWIVSSTQESTQQMDITITDASPDPAAPIHHTGSLAMRSQISLLNGSSPALPAVPAP